MQMNGLTASCLAAGLTEDIEGRFLTRECVLKQSVSVGGVQPVKTESAFGIASFLGRKGGLLALDDMAKPVERELRIGGHAR